MTWSGRLVVAAVALAACDSTVSVNATLERPTDPNLDPFAPAAGVQKVRMIVRGPERTDEAAVDAPAGTDRLSISEFPAEEVSIEVFGFDEVGNVRAYGRLGRQRVDGSLSATIPFRRSLAYVIHARSEEQNQPEGLVYVLDVATRTLVDRIRLEGVRPRARSVTARGGESILVAGADGIDAFVDEISTLDHSVRRIPLNSRPDVVLAVPDRPLGVAVGGSRLAFIDFDEGREVEGGLDIGGRVLDAVIATSGLRAIAAVDIFPPGLLDIDLERRRVEGRNVLVNPAGVALDWRTDLAYVVSSENQGIVVVDMDTGRENNVQSAAGQAASMASPTGIAAYSDEMNGLFGVFDPGGTSQPQIFPFSTFGRAGGSRSIPTFFNPGGIAADGPGRRVVVVGAGTSTETSGLTVIEPEFNELAPEATSTLYPLDPDDRAGPFDQRQRYRPIDVAITYGQ